MNNTLNFGEVFIQQMNNPECSMLSGAFMGMTMTWKYAVFFLLIGIFFRVFNKFIDFCIDYVKNKYKEYKK